MTGKALTRYLVICKKPAEDKTKQETIEWIDAKYSFGEKSDTDAMAEALKYRGENTLILPDCRGAFVPREMMLWNTDEEKVVFLWTEVSLSRVNETGKEPHPPA